MPKKTYIPIKYTARDFQSIKDSLVEYARRYYPDTFRDFNEASFGSLMLDTVAYVGDIMSFYLDYQANESFLDTAIEYKNIVKLSNSAGTAPDTDYYPILLRGSSMVSEEQVKYILVEDVDFSNPKNEIVVARTDSVTGSPTFYAVKAYGKVISGELVRQDIDVGTYTKFRRVELLEGENVSEVMQVVDSDGQEYFEVDYLSQDVVYKEFKNPNTTDRITAPKIIKPVVVPRRFTVDREPGRTFLQFGFGSESDLTSDEIVDPTKVLLEFDLDAGKVAEVRRSLDIINETPILGDLQFRNVDHLKARAYGAFYSQNRAVTAQDYKTLTYSMDPKFGSVKRCNIVLDQDSFKRNLNLYVISQNFDGTLEKTNNSIKENLKTWLNKYKMLSDTIDILDARIINLGIDFSVLSEEGINKAEILQRCFVALEDYFEDMPEIGEPLQITKIYNILNNVPGVVDTFKLDIYQKFGDEYSDTFFNIKENMSADGRYIIIPKNVIYEIKYINDDIRGVIK
jgi:hypothetical protein